MNTSSVLIIEDEKTLASNIRRYMEKYDYEVEVSECGNDALNQLVIETPDLVLLDLKLPDMNGLDILSRIRDFDPGIKIIMMTAFGDVETAVTAMKEGASDFLTKPLKLARLKELMDRVLRQPIEAESESAGETGEHYRFEELIGQAPSILRVKQKISQLLKSEARMPAEPPPVLVTGATGTGKELVARALHFQGPRAQEPFLNLSGSRMTPDLLDPRGALFETGAGESREPNILATVSGGTLYLDEIADASLDVQAKLVDLISDRDPVAAQGPRAHDDPDIRIIASTSRSLEDLVQAGRFRSDLYFRLHVINIDLPPLRDRGNDILLLAEHFLANFARRYEKPPLALGPGAESRLASYAWPGNIRELRNLLEQAVLTAEGREIREENLNLPAVTEDSGQTAATAAELPAAPLSLHAGGTPSEKSTLIAALNRSGWNVSLAARILGVSRDTVRYRIKKHNLSRPDSW